MEKVCIFIICLQLLCDSKETSNNYRSLFVFFIDPLKYLSHNHNERIKFKQLSPSKWGQKSN